MKSFSPILATLDRGIKGHIIEILSHEWPLTTKQLHNTIEARYVASSYQSVHKAANELVCEGVLQKIDGKIQIRYEWAENISKFGDFLKLSLTGSSGGHESGAPVTIEFTSLVSCIKFIINAFYDSSLNPGRRECACFWKHAYPIVGISKEEHDNLKSMFSRETHINVCGGDTFLDNMMSTYLAKLGKKGATGQKYSPKQDTFVNGDYILQVYFSKEFAAETDKLYRSIKNEQDFDLKTMFEFATKPVRISVLVFRSPNLADSLRNEAKELLGAM